jgi:hypothetical protein
MKTGWSHMVKKFRTRRDWNSLPAVPIELEQVSGRTLC